MNADAPRVLLVEDEDALRRSLRIFLEDDGFVVETAGSGEEALTLLESFRADVAVVDIRLPRMDGNTFVAEAGRRHPGLRFLICTGSNLYHPSPVVAGFGVRDEDVLRKPLHDLGMLSFALRMRLGRR